MLTAWIKKSVRYYGLRHLVLGCSVALSAAILCAALLTGHSLHDGLKKSFAKRIGPLKHACYFTERTVRASLAEPLQDMEAALLIPGELLDSAGNVCATHVQIIGVIPGKDSPPLPTPILNERAHHLVRSNEASIRFKKTSAFSVELPLGDTQSSRILRRSIQLPPFSATALDGFTRIPLDFALTPSTLPPVNIFVPITLLEEALQRTGQANLFVSTRGTFTLPLSCEDLGLLFQSTPPTTTITSTAIYLPQKLTALFASNTTHCTATFYLADSFEANGRQTPYGFVGAVTPSSHGTPLDLQPDEVVINAWLAQQLGVEAQQQLVLKWRRFEATGKLVPDERAFRIRAIIPTEEAARVKAVMPAFPGMKDVDSCAAWDVGMPMDEALLNDKENEAYWKSWRETPKLLMSATTGEACFGEIFGKAMSLQLDGQPEVLRQQIESQLTAEDIGALNINLVHEGAQAARGSTDFYGLFIGMLLILIVSSLLLASLTFSLTLDSRKKELALLLATGWSRQRCLIALFLEWIPTLLLASLAGTLLGCGLTRLLIWSLARFWRAAFAEATLTYSLSVPVVLISFLLVSILTGVILFFKLRALTRQNPTRLWRMADERMRPEKPASHGKHHLANISGTLFALLALVLLFSARGEQAHGAFFGAGFLLLLSLVIFIRSAATLWQSSSSTKQGPLLTGLARAAHLPRRNTPVVLMIALGTFLVIGVLSMKHDPAANTANPSSGSGGFASLVTSMVPYEREKGIEMARRVSGAKVVIPIRVHEGDTAGCLNMNAPVSPTVYGLDAQELARLRAFEPPQAGGVWSPLLMPLPNGCLPVLAADLTMLQYSLKATAHPKEGTRYPAPGATIQLVGVLPIRSTILQGALLMDEQAFLKAFPNEQGYRLWLCDYAPYLLRELTASATERRRPSPKLVALRHPEPGISIETTEERLRLLASVESTYLDMFLVFGGLGMILGLFGVALIIIRGVEERRHEFALLLALGLSRKEVLFLLLAEYGTLIATGLFAGLLPAMVAIQPAAAALRSEMPWALLISVIALLVASAMFCIVSSATFVTRSLSLDALKNE